MPIEWPIAVEFSQGSTSLSTDQPNLRLILSTSEAMRCCKKVLEQARFTVSKFDDVTLLCVRREAGSQRQFGLRLTFERLSSDLTQLTFSQVDTGLGTLHSELFKRRLLGLQKIIAHKAA
jgi:hypothetical protein